MTSIPKPKKFSKIECPAAVSHENIALRSGFKARVLGVTFDGNPYLQASYKDAHTARNSNAWDTGWADADKKLKEENE